MEDTLHITSGDMAGASLANSGLAGEVFVWHDILYEGPREPGWPNRAVLAARAEFLEQTTGGGLSRSLVLATLQGQYDKLAESTGRSMVLWFDACLFDQAMLCHLLACLAGLGPRQVELLCVDAFPGIEPYIGLGQLSPAQMAGVFGQRQPVANQQFLFAEKVDAAFALQDAEALGQLAALPRAPLPHAPAAAARWLQELPGRDGLGRLERTALAAVRAGNDAPRAIYQYVAARETPPQYWGDTTLWQKINALAEKRPPLVRLEGPAPRLPQWEGGPDLGLFRVLPA